MKTDIEKKESMNRKKYLTLEFTIISGLSHRYKYRFKPQISGKSGT